MTLRVGDKVRCVRGHTNCLEQGKDYVVLVVVTDGYTDRQGGPKGDSGVIVDARFAGERGYFYPYVWDCDRFELLKKGAEA